MMFKAKVLKGVLFLVITFSLALSAWARKVSENEINEVFDETVSQMLLLDKGYYELTPEEIKKLIAPSAAEIFKATIDAVRKQYGDDIGTWQIWDALAPNVEKNLEDMRDEIDKKVEGLLKSKK